MARRRKGSPVHGWVVIDKPEGITSTQVVGIVKRVFDAQKAGHAGTLDPMATGVLAVALGEATKTVPYAMDAQKTYRFTACWGEARDSDDAQGAVTGTSASRPTREAIEAAIPRFVGAVTQVPPAYSAIKVDGERAYDLAREGEEVVLEPRIVQIHGARLVSQPDSDHAEFEMLCGKGAYVRAWVRDLARELGTLGHVSQLRRTRIGSFSAEDAITLDKLKAFMHIPAAFEHLRPPFDRAGRHPGAGRNGPGCGSPTQRQSDSDPGRTSSRGSRKTSPQDDLQGLTVFLSTGEGRARSARRVRRRRVEAVPCIQLWDMMTVMTITTERKQEVITQYATNANDTGSPEVQVAVLSERIANLTEHFKTHLKDNHSRRGLIKMVSTRRRLLDYVKATDAKRYEALIARLGLRR